LKAEVAGRPLQDVARDLVNIARGGLRRRQRLSGGFVDETGYLAELDTIVESGLTPADRLLNLYHGPWKGDVTRAFQDLAY
jgi:glutamate--cysteine ligase